MPPLHGKPCTISGCADGCFRVAQSQGAVLGSVGPQGRQLSRAALAPCVRGYRITFMATIKPRRQPMPGRPGWLPPETG